MARKRTPSKKSQRKVIQILLEPITEPKKKHRYYSPRTQLIRKNQDRDALKRKYLGKNRKKLSNTSKELYKHVRQCKSSVVRRYNKDLEKHMKEFGYLIPQINHAKRNYSVVGKHVRIKVDKVVSRYNRNNTKALVRGKWIPVKNAISLQKRAATNARIEAYMDILGVDRKTARNILDEIKKETKLSYEFLALIY